MMRTAPLLSMDDAKDLEIALHQAGNKMMAASWVDELFQDKPAAASPAPAHLASDVVVDEKQALPPKPSPVVGSPKAPAAVGKDFLDIPQLSHTAELQSAFPVKQYMDVSSIKYSGSYSITGADKSPIPYSSTERAFGVLLPSSRSSSRMFIDQKITHPAGDTSSSFWSKHEDEKAVAGAAAKVDICDDTKAVVDEQTRETTMLTVLTSVLEGATFTELELYEVLCEALLDPPARGQKRATVDDLEHEQLPRVLFAEPPCPPPAQEVPRSLRLPRLHKKPKADIYVYE
jgi:hypothetical protein